MKWLINQSGFRLFDTNGRHLELGEGREKRGKFSFVTLATPATH